MPENLSPIRHWLLTWTTYGTWLPGDQRGFVSPVPDRETGKSEIHNIVGTEYDKNKPTLKQEARRQMKAPPVFLSEKQAKEIVDQFHETTKYRDWKMLAAAVMCNHVHLVVGIFDDLNPSTLLQVYKSYASRRLNQVFGKNENNRWWTQHGSKRKLPNRTAIIAAVRYVMKQQNPLAIWADETIEY